MELRHVSEFDSALRMEDSDNDVAVVVSSGCPKTRARVAAAIREAVSRLGPRGFTLHQEPVYRTGEEARELASAYNYAHAPEGSLDESFDDWDTYAEAVRLSRGDSGYAVVVFTNDDTDPMADDNGYLGFL